MLLPYSKFLIESRDKKIFLNKEIYEVKLEELDENDRGNINSISLNFESYILLSIHDYPNF